METVLKAIADWIKGILTAGIMSNLSGLFDAVNEHRPCAGAARTGVVGATGDEDLPEAAGDGRGCPGGRVHRALCRQDDPGSQTAAGCGREPRPAP